MSEFADPENIEYLIYKVKNVHSVAEVINIAEETFPNWISSSSTEYSEDYSYFNSNWTSMVELLKEKLGNQNIKKERIVLVKDIGLEQNKKLINMFADILTRSGFIVRCISDFKPCEYCGRILPTKDFYEIIKKVNTKNVPVEYLSHCKRCKDN